MRAVSLVSGRESRVHVDGKLKGKEVVSLFKTVRLLKEKSKGFHRLYARRKSQATMEYTSYSTELGTRATRDNGINLTMT